MICEEIIKKCVGIITIMLSFIYFFALNNIQKNDISSIKNEEIILPVTTVIPTNTIVLVITTIPVIKAIPLGPPKNKTSLIGCISYYESSWGKDPNVFQFTQGTWEHYGGVGLPKNAAYVDQEKIFWLAWNDAGKHHWAAQKGRCF